MIVLKSKYQRLETRANQLQHVVDELGAADLVTVRERIEEAQRQLQSLLQEKEATSAELGKLREAIVETNELAMLQEVGLYEFAHPLEDALGYRQRLHEIGARTKEMIRTNSAVKAPNQWQVNGSAREGKKMVSETAKLMLAAYNAEVENVIRTLRPHRLSASLDRLAKLKERIARNGRVMQISIADDYHRVRLEEVRLTADYLQKVEDEKEELRERRERQREEEKARREFEAEKERLRREAVKYATALRRLQEQGNEVGAAELVAKLEEIEAAIEGVEAREANIRAGYVYIISNLGSFGERMVKIGMTRRLDPEDRIRELGDASVPFRFDKHALIFSEDAVALEMKLHGALADRRVNRVNLRREFFYATPHEVLEVMEQIGGQFLTEFHEVPEAIEWRQSQHLPHAHEAAQPAEIEPGQLSQVLY